MTKVFNIVPRSTGIAATMAVLIILALFIGFTTKGAPIMVRIMPMVIMAGVMIPFGFFLLSSRRTLFTLSKDGLVVSHTMYGRSIAASDLVINEAKVLDLTRDTEYQGKWRANGFGLPDYSLGWFSLRNKEKALLFVTDKQKVVYIPTKAGFSILLSTSSPDDFVHALQETFSNKT